MKKIFFPLFATLALAACSGDDALVVDRVDNQTLEVSISLPATRAESGYTTATETERTVKTLDAYMFADGDGKLEKVYKNLITGDDWKPTSPSEEKQVILNGIQGKSARTILFVANGSEVTSLLENAAPGVVTLQNFKTLLTDALTAAPACPLLMTAEAAVSEWQGSEVPTVSAALQRVMARLDLKIFGTTAFILTKAELRNASTLSYIFPNAGFADCGKFNIDNTSPVGEDVESAKLYKSLFYMYAAPAAQMTLRLYGNQSLFGTGPAEAVFDIPLSNILPEGKENIESNTCYTIVIKDIDISDSGSFEVNVDFDVEVVD